MSAAFYKFFFFVLLVIAPIRGFADDSCDCPKLSCNTECEAETDVKFYSEKCEEGKRVKSCARPTCVPIENAPASCGAVSSVKKPIDLPVVQSAPVIVTRDIASVKPMAVAEVMAVEGKVWIRSGVSKNELSVAQQIYEKDRIETGDNGRAQIRFIGADNKPSGNILNVTPNSDVVIQESNLPTAEADKKRVVLDLLRGRIRNKVEKDKFKNDEQSHFRVRTQAAVAGVRGTDFVTSFELDGDEVVSKVETITGMVALGDSQMESKIELKKGESASYVAPKSVLTKSDKAEFVAKGYLTPVYKMSEKEILDLENATAVARAESGEKDARKPSSEDEKDICAEPVGKFNQCAWKCENNPLGEKKCRTDLPSVNCVRRICNANGQWTAPTRLPSSYYGACDGQKINVGPCDY